MYLIDSSVWVALFLDFDSQHQKAADIFSKIDDKIYLPYGVIAEVTTVLTYKHSKDQANNFLEFITDNNDIILVENQTLPEMDFFKKLKSNISFTDASLIFMAGKLNLALITFDKEVVKAAGKRKK